MSNDGLTNTVTYLDVGYDSLLIVTLQIIKQCLDKTTTYSSTRYSLMSVLCTISVIIHNQRAIQYLLNNGLNQLQHADQICADCWNKVSLVPPRILLLHTTHTRKQCNVKHCLRKKIQLSSKSNTKFI